MFVRLCSCFETGLLGPDRHACSARTKRFFYVRTVPVPYPRARYYSTYQHTGTYVPYAGFPRTHRCNILSWVLPPPLISPLSITSSSRLVLSIVSFNKQNDASYPPFCRRHPLHNHVRPFLRLRTRYFLLQWH